MSTTRRRDREMAEIFFEKIMAENFPKLEKDSEIQIQIEKTTEF